MHAVVAGDDEGNLCPLDEIDELLDAGAQLLLVVVDRPGRAVRREEALLRDGVDGQEHETGPWQEDESRLAPPERERYAGRVA